MRKICSSSKYGAAVSLSARALARSVPKGFSMITRDRSTSLASASSWMTSRSAEGGMLR